jgi:hypothetical protein
MKKLLAVLVASFAVSSVFAADDCAAKAAEKKINKSDLTAYKSYNHTDHAMVPGG